MVIFPSFLERFEHNANRMLCQVFKIVGNLSIKNLHICISYAIPREKVGLYYLKFTSFYMSSISEHQVVKRNFTRIK